MIITPNWPAPNNICAFTTLRSFGNLATHVDDDPAIVAHNRSRLINDYQLFEEPYWLNQIHSDIVVNLDKDHKTIDADGSYTTQSNVICAVLTADCLPIILCDKNGEEIAALHAGWKGILADIITKGVSCFQHPRKELLAWLGPAIGPKAFEVGKEVYDAFIAVNPDHQTAFTPSPKPNHHYLNIYDLAKHYLNRLGLSQIYGGEYCTYTEKDRFFSYRREGKTGRMATIIYKK